MAQRKEKREKEQLENLNQTAIAFHCQPVSPVFSPHLFFDLFFSRFFFFRDLLHFFDQI
jgi:hypothetical protein